MHIVQEKDMIYIAREKCIIKKGILRKERKNRKSRYQSFFGCITKEVKHDR